MLFQFNFVFSFTSILFIWNIFIFISLFMDKQFQRGTFFFLHPTGRFFLCPSSLDILFHCLLFFLCLPICPIIQLIFSFFSHLFGSSSIHSHFSRVKENRMGRPCLLFDIREEIHDKGGLCSIVGWLFQVGKCQQGFCVPKEISKRAAECSQQITNNKRVAVYLCVIQNCCKHYAFCANYPLPFLVIFLLIMFLCCHCFSHRFSFINPEDIFPHPSMCLGLL